MIFIGLILCNVIIGNNDVIIVNDEKEFEIVTNHFKQDINDDVINEVVKLLEELNEKDKNKIVKIIKDTIELLK